MVSTFFTYLLGAIAFVSLAVYVFGIPPEWKRAAERKALAAMGENKASFIMKDQINKIPTSDQRDLNQLKKGLGNTLGGGMKNPVGEQTGEAADKLTSPLTGR